MHQPSIAPEWPVSLHGNVLRDMGEQNKEYRIAGYDRDVDVGSAHKLRKLKSIKIEHKDPWNLRLPNQLNLPSQRLRRVVDAYTRHQLLPPDKRPRRVMPDTRNQKLQEDAFNHARRSSSIYQDNALLNGQLKQTTGVDHRSIYPTLDTSSNHRSVFGNLMSMVQGTSLLGNAWDSIYPERGGLSLMGQTQAFFGGAAQKVINKVANNRILEGMRSLREQVFGGPFQVGNDPDNVDKSVTLNDSVLYSSRKNETSLYNDQRFNESLTGATLLNKMARAVNPRLADDLKTDISQLAKEFMDLVGANAQAQLREIRDPEALPAMTLSALINPAEAEVSAVEDILDDETNQKLAAAVAQKALQAQHHLNILADEESDEELTEEVKERIVDLQNPDTFRGAAEIVMNELLEGSNQTTVNAGLFVPESFRQAVMQFLTLKSQVNPNTFSQNVFLQQFANKNASLKNAIVVTQDEHGLKLEQRIQLIQQLQEMQQKAFMDEYLENVNHQIMNDTVPYREDQVEEEEQQHIPLVNQSVITNILPEDEDEEVKQEPPNQQQQQLQQFYQILQANRKWHQQLINTANYQVDEKLIEQLQQNTGLIEITIQNIQKLPPAAAAATQTPMQSLSSQLERLQRGVAQLTSSSTSSQINTTLQRYMIPAEDALLRLLPPIIQSQQPQKDNTQQQQQQQQQQDASAVGGPTAIRRQRTIMLDEEDG